MRIAIVDDDKVFVEKLQRELENFFHQKEEPVQIFSFNGLGLLDHMEKQNNYNLYLLDVEMPEMDGVKLAENIHTLDEGARIVFLTSYERYAVKGYRVGAYDFLLKDSYKKDLAGLLERVCREEEESREEYYAILSETKSYKIFINDILYLTKEKQYALLHCLDGNVYKQRETLENILKQLPEDRFVFIDKGTHVNIKHIIKIDHLEITLKNKQVLQVSRRAKSLVQEKLANDWKKELG